MTDTGSTSYYFYSNILDGDDYDADDYDAGADGDGHESFDNYIGEAKLDRFEDPEETRRTYIDD